jgi:(hydroxyamino)benzene mutase
MTVQSSSKQILMHGLALILVGLVWGFAVPATPFPRLALGAHVQFETNGMLFVLLAVLLLALPNNAGPKTVRVMLVSAWATWFMVLSEVANAWWGTNQMLPIAASQAKATGGAPWQEMVVQLCHIPAAIGLIAAVAMLMAGLRADTRGYEQSGR